MIGFSIFNNIRLLHKMMILSTLGVVLFFVGILFVALPKVESKIMAEKKSSTKHIVETAISIVEGYAAKQAAGKLDETSAKAAAMQAIAQIRYDGNNYLWISDLKAGMVLHPIKPKLNGKDMSAFQDPTGKKIFFEFAEISKLKGGGFVDYMWPKPGKENPVSKISYVQLFKKWGWIVGTGNYIDDIAAQLSQLKMSIWLISAVIGGLVLTLAFFISRAISAQVSKAVQFAKIIADGNLSQTLDIVQKDEIGTLSAALNRMVANLQKMFKNIMRDVETISSSSTSLSAVSQQMAASAEQTSGKSDTVSTATEEMSSNMTSVSAAMEQTSTNTNMVAVAAEEMTATINEIAKNAESARSISDQAVQETKTTGDQMSELGRAAQAIGKVTETITEISEQTNLLALNATIEAARAGEAGKGFAVVANEIKELAKQTAEATLDIKRQIEGIQNSTGSTVGAIEKIGQVIDKVNEIVATIATAVDEQSITTREISNNITQVSSGIGEVNENIAQSSQVVENITQDIAEVNQASGEMNSSSSQVNLSAQELSGLAEQLKAMMTKFTI